MLCRCLEPNHGARSCVGFAAASSLGAGIGLLRLPDMQRGVAAKGTVPSAYLNWSAAWGVAAAVVIAMLLLLVGPGLK